MNLKDRKQKIEDWFNNPYNALLVVILTFAFALRLFFYIKTQGQTLWWDEAEYMSAAKDWAFGVPYEYNPQRPPLFQAISALAFMIGLGESFIKFAFVLLPSLFLVGAIYYLGKEMYNEKVAVISAALAAVSWTFLFWTARMQPDFFSMSFQVLAILFMWKHWKNNSLKYVLLSGFFAALGFYFKISALLVPMIFIVFILIKDRFSAIKDKFYYYFSASFLLTLTPYFIWSFLNFGTPFAFKKGYVDAPTDYPIGWYNVKYYQILTDNVLFLLLIFGVVFAIRFLLYLDILVKDKKGMFNADLYSVLTLAFISAFYIFYQRNTDDRWVFLWLPFIFMLSAQVLLKFGEFLDKYKKYLGTIIVVAILLISMYLQLTHAAMIVNVKLTSYSPVKEAALWMKENTLPTDIIFSVSYTQAVYYTERPVLTYSRQPQFSNVDEFDEFILEHKPKYIMWSVFEMHPAYIQDWVNEHLTAGDISAVYGRFADAQQTQPMLFIFQPDYNKFK